MTDFIDLTETTNLLFGAGVFASVMLFFLAVGPVLGTEKKRFTRRLARAQGRTKSAPAKPAALTVRINESDSSIESLDKLIKRLLPQPDKLRARLARTGRSIALGEYLLVSLLTALVVFLVLSGVAGLKPAAALLAALAAGFGLPHLVVNAMIGRRLNKFTVLFPEAIDLIVRGLKSGLPVMESIKVVGQEMPDPVGIEFRRIAEAFGFGRTLDQALAAAATRLDTPEFRFFVISLSIQQETGGNLGETLENLADILRRRKQMKLKVRAMSSEARASAYIIGALPFLIFGVIMTLNPDYALVLFHDPRGRVMLGTGLCSMFIGCAVMFKMARFEI